MKEINKLVRNKVPALIKRNNQNYKTRILTDEEYRNELLDKLIEEAAEVKQATDNLERIVELADVCEVIDALKEAYQIDSGDLTRAQTRKRNERGDFSERIFLESIDEQ